MFRFRFYLEFSLAAMAAAACAAPCPAAQTTAPQSKEGRIRLGIDNFEAKSAGPLRDKRVGLITNQTGVDSNGKRTIDMLARHEGIKLVAIFSPEHGIEGHADAPVANSTDVATRVPIYSLYGETRRPTDAMLKGIDVLMFDIQDAGVRFYTYVTTMAYCMEEAAKHGITFVVLDRPNPLGGELIEGPMLDRQQLSFVGYFPMPAVYGMTMGELAQMFNGENRIGADLHVITLTNWRRNETYDQTGLKWIPPSPNLRTLNAVFLYPGIEILQAGSVSVGRGTDTPFEKIGAPWIQGAELAAELNRRAVPGVKFQTAVFTPDDGLYKGEYCQGVSITITDRAALDSMRMGLEIAEALRRLYPKQFQLEKINELLGSQATLEQLKRGEAPVRIEESWREDLDKFRRFRLRYLLYH
jgi:uncharacterized protein YbbC (DUF1343 family)